MHIAEGILPLAHAAAGWAAAVPALAWSGTWIASGTTDERRRRRSVASMATALIFAATFLPIPVPVAGVTSHVCATPLLALVLGPRAVVVPTSLSLAVQALFLGHGGITTLGANIVTLGVVGPFLAWGLARALRTLGVPTFAAVFLACALGDLGVYLADAGILGIALSATTAFERTFVAILLGFLPVQVPLALLEGAVSAAALRFLARRRAHLVPAWIQPHRAPAQLAMLMLAMGMLGTGCSRELQGADEAVLGQIATQAGRAPKPWFDPGRELVLTGACIGCFTAGLVVGLGWSRIRQEGSS
jgi:cobalt/nickel transport system permease protein